MFFVVRKYRHRNQKIKTSDFLFTRVEKVGEASVESGIGRLIGRSKSSFKVEFGMRGGLTHTECGVLRTC